MTKCMILHVVYTVTFVAKFWFASGFAFWFSSGFSFWFSSGFSWFASGFPDWALSVCAKQHF